MVRLIKTVHTAAWLAVEVSMAHLLYAGFTRRSGRTVRVAAWVVGLQTLVFVVNRFRCPLTQLAESLGAEEGSVTDIYLPQRLARNLPVIHAPLLVLAAGLHLRNRRTTRGRRRAADDDIAVDRDHPLAAHTVIAAGTRKWAGRVRAERGPPTHQTMTRSRLEMVSLPSTPIGSCRGDPLRHRRDQTWAPWTL